jgi:transposase
MLIIDAQSMKTTGKGEERGFDGKKKVKGRKRQIVVDTQGNLYQVLVHRANIHDSRGEAVWAGIVLKQYKQVKKILADLGYRGFFEEIVRKTHKCTVDFSTKITRAFVIQPKRWIVDCRENSRLAQLRTPSI